MVGERRMYDLPDLDRNPFQTSSILSASLSRVTIRFGDSRLAWASLRPSDGIVWRR